MCVHGFDIHALNKSQWMSTPIIFYLSQFSFKLRNNNDKKKEEKIVNLYTLNSLMEIVSLWRTFTWSLSTRRAKRQERKKTCVCAFFLIMKRQVGFACSCDGSRSFVGRVYLCSSSILSPRKRSLLWHNPNFTLAIDSSLQFLATMTSPEQQQQQLSMVIKN